MAKRRSKKQIFAELRAQQPERDRLTRRLQERIAYHKTKLEEERGAKETS